MRVISSVRTYNCRWRHVAIREHSDKEGIDVMNPSASLSRFKIKASLLDHFDDPYSYLKVRDQFVVVVLVLGVHH